MQNNILLTQWHEFFVSVAYAMLLEYDKDKSYQ